MLQVDTMNNPQCRCELCEHEWIPRVKIPLACPKCKSYDWNRPLIKIEDEQENKTLPGGIPSKNNIVGNDD